MQKFDIRILSIAEKFIISIPEPDKVKVFSSIEMLSIDYDYVYTKTIKNPIRELIVKKYRILFLIQKNTIYIISGFIKKTQKTPKQEIDRAEAVYKLLSK